MILRRWLTRAVRLFAAPPDTTGLRVGAEQPPVPMIWCIQLGGASRASVIRLRVTGAGEPRGTRLAAVSRPRISQRPRRRVG